MEQEPGYQGTFTPSTDPADTITLPQPASGVDYYHGYWWDVVADGYVRTQSCFRGEVIRAVNWFDPGGALTAEQVIFSPQDPAGRNTLGCNEMDIQLEIGPPGAGVLTQIADRVRGFRLQRGRTNNWYDTPITGVNMELDNRDGFFSNLASLPIPELRLGHACIIKAQWRNIEYPIFVGSLRGYSEPSEPEDDFIILYLQDATYELAAPIRGEWSPGDPADSADVRIGKILDKSTLAAFPRDFQQSLYTLTNYATQRTLLDEITLSCMSSGGVFFIDNDGLLTFLNEDRLAGRNLPQEAYFTDTCPPGSVGLPYASIDIAWSDEEFGNEVIINNVSQGEEASVQRIAKDQDSIDRYGLVPWTHPQLVITNVDGLQNLADWELERRKDAFYRVESITCYPINNDRIFTVGLAMRLGWSMYIYRNPPGSTSPLRAEYVVEGMEIAATGTSWQFKFYVSPALNIGTRRYGEFNYGDLDYGGRRT